MRANTFVCDQVSPKETIRYEVPTSQKWIFDDFDADMLILKQMGHRKPTIQNWLDLLRSSFPETIDQVKVTKKPTVLWLRGWKGTVTTYDYPI